MAQYQEVDNIEEIISRPSTPNSNLSRSEIAPDELGQYNAIRQPASNHSRASAESLDQPHPEPGPERPRRCYAWWQRIGILGVLTIVIGTLVHLASLAVLIFLWRGAEASLDRNEPKLWQTIVWDGWAPGTVTICSAAMLTSISLQLGLLVAALAAIMLETSGMSFKDIPLLSTERASKSSPIGILPAVFRQTTHGTSGLVHSFIVTIAVTIMLVSTFISTILLSDFETHDIAAPAMTSNKTITFEHDIELEDVNRASYWRSKPAAQWRFAEAQIGKSSPGDTGDTYRAMLPFLNETSRTSLEFYSGPAVVANTRTICAPLSLDSFSIVQEPLATESLVSGLRKISGGGTLLRVGEEGEISTFECQLPTVEGHQTNWPISLCFGASPEGQKYPSVASSDPKSGMPYVLHPITILNTTKRLVLDVEVNDTDDSVTEDLVPKHLQNSTSKSKGLWTTVYDAEGLDVFSASLCYFNLARPLEYNVTMYGPTIPFEPTDTDDICLQFGSGALFREFANRGLLNLDIGSRIRDIKDELDRAAVDTSFGRVWAELPLGSKSAWSMRYGTFYEPQWKAHQAHTAMTYYDWLLDYNAEHPVTTVHSAQGLIPMGWTGLVIVLILVGYHLILVFATVELFMIKTRASALGNAWQAVAQIARATNALESADRMLDKEVDKWTKTTGLDKEVYSISESADGNTLEIQLRKRTGG
ncbi:Hypothetical protein NCS54_00620400 [Fusarium falciforme]|uniref:Hypothetical protein n=1 Tax=Fusarium falciforme TaxID=195108 RepID=UPI00230059D8|nr:Hypothetical protein NCS54_00620400 [Fusarium falciforme]WAO88842.1 Hypothetical protein NCS54_00620400 [Fusarium falciforme]